MGLFQGDNQPVTRFNGLRTSESLLGTPLPILIGQQRISWKLLWYGAFSSQVAKQQGSGGSGASKGGSSYVYSASVVGALCMGPCANFLGVWDSIGRYAMQTESETVTLPATGAITYTPANQANFKQDLGVSAVRAYSVTANDYGSPGSTILSGTQNAPLTYTSNPTPPEGQYTIVGLPNNPVYLFNSSQGGASVIVNYVAFRYFITETELAIAAASVTVQYQSEWSYDGGVKYYPSGVSLTPVESTPTVAGTYFANHGRYQFAPADFGQGVDISYTYNDPNKDTNAPSTLNLTFFGGALGQSPWSYLASTFPAESIGYSEIAYVGSVAMYLGYSPVLPQLNFEVLGPYAFGNGIPDANPADAIYGLLTNPAYKYNTPSPIPIDISLLGLYTVTGAVTSGVFTSGEVVKQSSTGATANLDGTVTGSNPMILGLITGSADVSHTWVGQTSGAVYTPTAEPTSSSARAQWSANNFFISDILDSQTSLMDLIGRWCEAGQVYVSWDEGKLKFIPLCDSTTVGNGVVYSPPTQPVIDLDDNDFVTDGKNKDPITIEQTPWQNRWNRVNVRWSVRTNDYNADILQVQDEASVQQFGLMSETAQDWQFICTENAAQFAANMRLQRLSAIYTTYRATLRSNFAFLSPGDVITVTDGLLNTAGTMFGRTPIRITKMTDDPKQGIQIEAEDFPWSVGTALINNVQAQLPSNTNDGPQANPGDTIPVIFEVPNQAAQWDGGKIYVFANGANVNWGGFQVYVSFNGTDYSYYGMFSTPARIGVTTGDFPGGSTTPSNAAKLYVFQPPAGGSSSLASIYANADGAVISIPWSSDNVSPSLGGWESSSGVPITSTLAAQLGHNTSANAAYNKANYPTGFTGTTWVNTSAATLSVNSAIQDDSLNPITPCHVSPVDVHALFPGYSGPILSHETLWFGTGSSTAAANHMDVGIDCDTTAYAAAMCNDRKARGFNGVILDWYGASDYTDKCALKVKAQIATMTGFKYAIMIDTGDFGVHTGYGTTAQLEAILTYLNSTYFGDPNYLTQGGNPVVYLWGASVGGVNYATAKAFPGVTMYWIGQGPSQLANSWIDGVFDWAHPYSTSTGTFPTGTGAFSSDPYNAAAANSFLTSVHSSAKGSVPCISPGFNGYNTRIKEGGYKKGTYMPRDSGKCWISQAAVVTANLPTNIVAIQLVTGTDYEEGSEYESAIDNQIAVTASITSGTLTWSVAGSAGSSWSPGDETSISSYNILASPDGINCAIIGTQATGGSNTFNLATAGLATGTYSIYVVAVGQPCIRSQASSPHSYAASGSGAGVYNFTNFDAVINAQIGFGASEVVIVLEPISFEPVNKYTPNYVFTSAWATSISSPTGQLFTAASTTYPGAGTIAVNTCAQGVDNTAFPVAFQSPFVTAWKAAVTAAINHMKTASYASKIAYIRVGGGMGGEWTPVTVAALETQCSPANISGLQTAWVNYMSAVQTAILAPASGFRFDQGIAGGQLSGVNALPYSFADAETVLSASNGFGIGNEGLQNFDLTAFSAHGTASGGSSSSGFSSNDFLYNWALATASFFECQTVAPSNPSYVGNPPSGTMGSLVPLIPFAIGQGTTHLEIYYEDWQVAYDSSSPYHASYSAIYTALFATARSGGGGSGSNYPQDYLDNVNTLVVNMQQSGAVLQGVTAADRDAFVTLSAIVSPGQTFVEQKRATVGQSIGTSASGASTGTAGPNVALTATDVNIGGSAWSNPNGVLGSSTFANVTLNNSGTTKFSDFLVALTDFSVPNPGIGPVTGITVSFTAYYTHISGAAFVPNLAASASLGPNVIYQGTNRQVTLTTSPTPYTLGSATDLWGIPAGQVFGIDGIIDNLGAAFSAENNVSGSDVQIFIQNVQISVSWSAAGAAIQWAGASDVTGIGPPYANALMTTSDITQWLAATVFGFGLPFGFVLDGIGVSVKGNTSSSPGVITAQLMYQGLRIGVTKSLSMAPGFTQNFVFGSATDTWNAQGLLDLDALNNSSFGVAFQCSGEFGDSPFLANAQITLYGTSTKNLELVSYENADLVGLNTFSLSSFRRGIQGSYPCDHPPGSVFARLDQATFVYVVPASYTGSVIFFKFLSFNAYGNQLQLLSAVTPFEVEVGGLSPGAIDPITGNLLTGTPNWNVPLIEAAISAVHGSYGVDNIPPGYAFMGNPNNGVASTPAWFPALTSGGGTGGSIVNLIVIKTAVAYTAAAWDYIEADTSGGGFAITFPSAAANPDIAIAVKKVSVDSNVLSFTPNGGDTIEVASISTKKESLYLVSDGVSNWSIFAGYGESPLPLAQNGDIIRWNYFGDNAWDAVNGAMKFVTAFACQAQGDIESYGATRQATAPSVLQPSRNIISPTVTDSGGIQQVAPATASAVVVIGVNEGANANAGGYGFYAFNRWTIRYALGGISNVRYWMGLAAFVHLSGTEGEIFSTTRFATDTPTGSMLGFRFSAGTDTHWQAVAIQTGGGITIVDTGINPDTNPHTFEFTFDSTTVRYFIDGVLRATITTTLPLVAGSLAEQFVCADNKNTATSINGTFYHMMLSLK